MGEFVLDSVACSQRDCDFPNVIAVCVGHRGTVATPVVKGAVDLGGREATRVIVHVNLECDVGLCKSTSQNSHGH